MGGICPCGGDGVQETEVPSSPGREVAVRLPWASSGVFPCEKSDELSGYELQQAPELQLLSVYALDMLIIRVFLLQSTMTTSLSPCFFCLPSSTWLLSVCLPSSQHYSTNPSTSPAAFYSTILSCPHCSSCCLFPLPVPLHVLHSSPTIHSCLVLLHCPPHKHIVPLSQGRALSTPPWFSLVLPLSWLPPSLTQVCKSLLPMSASKLVYPPPIPAFITLLKWSDISSVEASRRCSQYPNHESWHNKWRQSTGGPGHLSHCATSHCQLHYSLKLPEKIT